MTRLKKIAYLVLVPPAVVSVLALMAAAFVFHTLTNFDELPRREKT
jgi:hypothetical protein